MNCQEVMELMQRSLDGDLNASETSRMNEHVQTCPDCAAMLERLTRLSNGLAQLPKVVPSFSIVDSILPQLEQLQIASEGPGDAAPADRPEAHPSTAPLEPRSSRTRRRTRTLQRISGVVAAGIVVGLLLVSHPSSWLPSAHDDNDAASMPQTMSAENSANGAAPADKMEVRKFAASMQESGASDEPSSSPEASDAPQLMFGAADAPTPAAQAPENSAAAGADPDASASAPPKQSSLLASPRTEPQAKIDGDRSASSEPQTTPGLAPQAAPEPPAPGDAGADASADSSVAGFAPADVWPSPDGKLQAKIAEGTLEIIRTDDQSVVFESAVPAGGAFDGVRWEDDSSAVHYVRTEADGTKQALLWTAATGQETEDAAQ